MTFEPAVVSTDAFVEPMSIAQLVARRLDPVDPWRLALVQRHLVWDEVRMAHLLDSLLAGYPVGSLLVCRVRHSGHVLVERDGKRRAEPASAGTWQLLDGQQRVNAFVSLFTEDAKFGRFYLHMTRARIPEEVVTRRRDKRRELDYIGWRSDDAGGTEPLVDRELYLDLGRWHKWAVTRPTEALRATAAQVLQDSSAAIAVLNEIDPAFADHLGDREAASAATRLSRLIDAWTSESIPVQHFTVESPLDVLQVFSRINLEGVRLDGEDVFFAAVKTEWPEAEEHLDRIAAASPLLNRVTALRILARLASRARSREDLFPLRVDRLNGSRGRQLVETMERLAADDSVVMERFGVLGRMLTNESRLGYALRLIDSKLLDHVFGWAAVNRRAEEDAHVRENLEGIEAYLVGAQAFRYSTIFLDRFLRLGFAEATAAGSRSERFPTERIVAGMRRAHPGLRRGQQWVAPIETDDERRHVMDQNATLFLAILQNLPYELPLRDRSDAAAGLRQVEWDHIYPQARANKMRVRHPVTAYLVHHADRRLVWSGSNLWALDRPINTSASDRAPSAKFAMLDALPDPTRRLPSRWPSADHAQLADSERAALLEAERLLENGDVETAMQSFRRYSVDRGLRLYAEIATAFPEIELFAPSAAIDPDAFQDAPAEDLAERLGVDLAPTPELAAAEQTQPSEDPRLEHVSRSADAAGVGDQLRDVVATAQRLGLGIRPNRNSVMVTPAANRSRMLFTVWPQRSKSGGQLSIYRWAPAIAQFFPSISEDEARAALGPDGFGTLLADDVAEFLDRLRRLIEPAVQGSLRDVPTLTGEDIRRIAWNWLRSTDPDRNGVHYYDIAHAVQAEGQVGGKDQMATVRGAIVGRGDRFEQTGPGHYTWRDAAGATSRAVRYWAMRTDPNRREDLWRELMSGRLRQGWGWDPEMDLELIADLVADGKPLSDWQREAWGNRRMLTSLDDAIHVGDIVLVPHMPEHRRFSLVRVTGPYEFDGGRAFGDYGHILPVALMTGDRGIGYTDGTVPVKLQTSLGNRARLWNLDAFAEPLEDLAAPSVTNSVLT